MFTREFVQIELKVSRAIPKQKYSIKKDCMCAAKAARQRHPKRAHIIFILNIHLRHPKTRLSISNDVFNNTFLQNKMVFQFVQKIRFLLNLFLQKTGQKTISESIFFQKSEVRNTRSFRKIFCGMINFGTLFKFKRTLLDIWIKLI